MPGADDQVNAAALSAIAGAVYPAILSEPATVRSRAQAAYTVASAVAAAVTTAGIVGNIGDYPWWTQIVGCAALGLWLLAACLYINVSRRVLKPPQGEQGDNGDVVQLTAEAFVNRSVADAREESDALEKRLTWAAKSTWGAIVFTGASLGLALALGPSVEQAPVSKIVLTPAGVQMLSGLCPQIGPLVEGRLDFQTLDEPYAVIREVDGCGANPMTLRVPPKQIQSTGTSED